MNRKTRAALVKTGCPDHMHSDILAAQELVKVDVFGVISDRVPYGDESMYAGIEVQSRCRDCGTPLGWLHVPGCMVEACPRCKAAQAFGCPCATLN
jgi:hypothetical protein